MLLCWICSKSILCPSEFLQCISVITRYLRNFRRYLLLVFYCRIAVCCLGCICCLGPVVQPRINWIFATHVWIVRNNSRTSFYSHDESFWARCHRDQWKEKEMSFINVDITNITGWVALWHRLEQVKFLNKNLFRKTIHLSDYFGEQGPLIRDHPPVIPDYLRSSELLWFLALTQANERIFWLILGVRMLKNFGGTVFNGNFRTCVSPSGSAN